MFRNETLYRDNNRIINRQTQFRTTISAEDRPRINGYCLILIIDRIRLPASSIRDLSVFNNSRTPESELHRQPRIAHDELKRLALFEQSRIFAADKT